jgi:hypothetical protein
VPSATNGCGFPWSPRRAKTSPVPIRAVTGRTELQTVSPRRDCDKAAAPRVSPTLHGQSIASKNRELLCSLSLGLLPETAEQETAT